MIEVDLLLADELPDAGAGRTSATSTILLPTKLPPITRPLRRAVHERRDRQRSWSGRCAAALLDHAAPGARRACSSTDVDAAAEREEHVLVAPHHALGHAGGAAGVEDVAVVGRAGPKSRSGEPDAMRVLVSRPSRGRRGRRRCRPRSRSSAAAAAAASSTPRDPRRELALVHERHQVGVVEEVARARPRRSGS